jgi:hypothetical protein
MKKRIMKRIFIGMLVALPWLTLPAQDTPKSGLTVTGYTRATGYFGVFNQEAPTLRSLYNETSVKLRAKTGTWGQAFTDARFRAGTEFGKDFSTIDIREAYLDLYLGKFDFRIGKQISPWGRADGWNPTDNLTPSNYFARSPDPDDMRIGNFRIRGQYNPFTWLKIEADAIPWYTPSVYRFDQVDLPAFVTIASPSNPGFIWNKSSVATRLDLIFPGIEGSVSWFRGYDPLPALKPGLLPAPPFTDFRLELLQVPFQQQTFGADFATVLMGTGVRGEIAFKIPHQGDSTDTMLPKTDLSWVISIDRELGPVRLIVGYMGKYVYDFIPAAPPQAFDPALLSNPEVWPMLGPMLTGQIGYYNRILYDQTHQWSHTLMFRPSVSLFRESLDIEVATLYNFTTKEYLLYPKATYHVTDGLLATAGYQYYQGESYTRFNWIRKAFNGPFFEFRLTF